MKKFTAIIAMLMVSLFSYSQLNVKCNLLACAGWKNNQNKMIYSALMAASGSTGAPCSFTSCYGWKDSDLKQIYGAILTLTTGGGGGGVSLPANQIGYGNGTSITSNSLLTFNSTRALIGTTLQPLGSLAKLRVSQTNGGSGVIDFGEYTSGRGAIWINSGGAGNTPSATNYALAADQFGNTFVNAPSGGSLNFQQGGTIFWQLDGRFLNAPSSAYGEIVSNSSFGLKVGSGNNAKLSFYQSSPIIQPLATTDLGTVLSSLGLRASGSAYPITTSGAVTFSGFFKTNNLATSYAEKTANYTILNSDYTINCTSALDITLPTAATNAGRIFVIKNSSVGIVNIYPTGSETIDGLAVVPMSVQYSAFTVQSNGINYILIAKF